MVNISACLSSKKDDWQTPRNFFDPLNELLKFTLDPCANAENNLQLHSYITAKKNGLALPWGQETVFCNPPYGREQKKWVEKALTEVEAKTCLLIPARPDTKMWQDQIFGSRYARVCFLRGRIRFVGAPSSAPFPCALVLIHWGLRQQSPEYKYLSKIGVVI